MAVRPPLAVAALGAALGGLGLTSLQGAGLAKAEAILVPATRAAHRRPTVARQRMLVIHDAAAGRERLVLETWLRDVGEPAAWLVPIPARPEVTVASRSVFPALHQALPIDVWGLDPMAGLDGKDPPPPAPEEVAVTPRHQGALTATVIAASDEAALRRWRDEGGVVETPPDTAWREHYARLGYWLVALRFTPPRVAPEGPPVRTAVRVPPLEIDFDAALPFVPLREPAYPRPVVEQERETEVWLVATALGNPVALDESGATRRWVRPLVPRQRWKNGRAAMEKVLGETGGASLPPGPLTVQTFNDRHRRRDGLGDAVFGAFQFREEAVAPSAERLEALRPLLWALDPTLANEGTPP